MVKKSGIISRIREKTMLSRSDFARMLGVSENYLYRVETGSRKPSLKMLEQIARLSGISLEKMMDVVIEPDEAGAERTISDARTCLDTITKLRRERRNRMNLEAVNSSQEQAIEHLTALIQLHFRFEDIVCQDSLPRKQRQQKLEELAKTTLEEGEVSFNEIMVILRVKRSVLKSWTKSGKRTYKCLFIEGLEVAASTPGEAAMRLCCFDCKYHESMECTGYGDEKRPENLIALLARMEANGIYNRTEQSKLLEESFGIKMSAHQIAESVYRHRNGQKVPEGAFNLEGTEGMGKK